MIFKKKLMFSTFLSIAFFIGSLIMPLIPCKVSPLVPNPTPQWTFCSLNPDTAQTSIAIREYFGYTSQLTPTYFITLIIIFLVAMVFFHYATRRKLEKRR
ncbi:MAG: hypothetical protein NUV97_03955 [archaeon]|nr:hypothetical protein [archaeon]MCR4323827.1 hypothetical protein [Nanoarchaeota archaeon]